MATALDRWDEEGGAQNVSWPLPYEASDLRDVERRVLECLGAALVGEWNDLPTDVQRRLFVYRAVDWRRCMDRDCARSARLALARSIGTTKARAAFGIWIAFAIGPVRA